MIILEGVTKIVGTGPEQRQVLVGARARIPSNRRIAVLGPSQDDKGIFIDLLAGLVLPTAGRIIRSARVSFPVGHVGGFARELSVRLNVAHVARLYGADVEPVVDFVAQVAKLGAAFNRPYGDLPNPARKDLSEILAFSIPFDVYLLNDAVVRSTRGRFNREARALFEARAKTSGMIITSQNISFVREFCEMGLVLSEGRLHLFKNLEKAISVAARNQSNVLPKAGKRGRNRERTIKPREIEDR
jgi:capsular polysaccharide transport system ATP-binding protein